MEEADFESGDVAEVLSCCCQLCPGCGSLLFFSARLSFLLLPQVGFFDVLLDTRAHSKGGVRKAVILELPCREFGATELLHQLDARAVEVIIIHAWFDFGHVHLELGGEVRLVYCVPHDLCEEGGHVVRA